MDIDGIWIGGVTVTKGRHAITHCMVADDSARINLSLWDTQVSGWLENQKQWDLIDVVGR